jgi:hypothetical protein
MPYKRVDPVPEKEILEANGDEDFVSPVRVGIMINERYHGHFSVCQKIRDIYLATTDENIKLDCRIAMAMTKKMHERLKYYQQKEAKEQEVKNGG